MINRVLKLLGALFFAAIYIILGVLIVVAAAGLVACFFLQSQPGVIIFALALAFLCTSFFAIAHKPTRSFIGDSDLGELPMLLFGVVVGTAIGMLTSVLALLLGFPQFAITIFLFWSVFAPIAAMVLERVGLLDAFDMIDLSDD